MKAGSKLGLSDLGQRRDVRYPLHLPVIVKATGGGRSETSGLSDNISVRGVLFFTANPIPQGSSVRMFVRFPDGIDDNFGLAGMGKVLRVSRAAPGKFAMAIGCDRPLRVEWRDGKQPPQPERPST
jgi:hypothetical protein